MIRICIPHTQTADGQTNRQMFFLNSWQIDRHMGRPMQHSYIACLGSGSTGFCPAGT